MHKFFSQSPYYEKPPRGGGAVKRRSVLPSATPASAAGKDLDKVRFSIQHYAGKVTYTAEQWLDKNRGFLQPELSFLLSTSSSSLLSSLFAPSSEAKAEKGKSTVLSTFRASLRQLSATLLQTSARYVRCIKPNALKVAGKYDGHFVARQLRYTGVAAVVEIQRSGYPISLPKSDFVSRYRSCAFSAPEQIAATLSEDEKCTNLLMMIQQLQGLEVENGEDWISLLKVQLGKTKVFLREEVVKHIEKAREAIFEEGAASVQRAARGLIARRIVKLAASHMRIKDRVRKALDARQAEAATAAFNELQKVWDEAGVSAGLNEGLLERQRELAQLSAEVSQLDEALQAEKKVVEALTSAIAAAKETGGANFVTLKVQLQVAQEAGTEGLSTELQDAIKAAMALLEEEEKKIKEAEADAKAAALAADAEAKKAADDKLEEYKKWEAEVERQEIARRKEKEARAAGLPVLDAGMVQVTVEVRNDPRPEKGTGIVIDNSNTVTALVKGSYGAKDARIRIGDVIVAVDGTSVTGRKAVSAMDEKASSYKLTVQRMEAEGGGGGDGGVDMEGWLTKVKAVDGRAVRMPEKRWVVLQGTTLTWYKDSKGEHEQSSQSLENAVCTLPSRSDGYQMKPAMQAFAKLHKYPFMLSWPNKAVAHELVFAASTSADRAAWAQAMKDAIERAKSGAPTCGWLYKEGGRKSGLAIGGWKKRWFVMPKLNQGRVTADSELKYFESPSSNNAKGAVRLLGADVFIPKEVRGIKADYRNNFCLTSLAVEKGKTVTICTLLAATSIEDRDMWVRSLSQAVKPDAARPKKTDGGGGGGGSGGGGDIARAAANRQVAGADVGGAALQAGQSTNLEQMTRLPEEDLKTLRIKQLKAVLDHLGIDYGEALEKKDLIAKITKARGDRVSAVALS